MRVASIASMVLLTACAAPSRGWRTLVQPTACAVDTWSRGMGAPATFERAYYRDDGRIASAELHPASGINVYQRYTYASDGKLTAIDALEIRTHPEPASDRAPAGDRRPRVMHRIEIAYDVRRRVVRIDRSISEYARHPRGGWTRVGRLEGTLRFTYDIIGQALAIATGIAAFPDPMDGTFALDEWGRPSRHGTDPHSTDGSARYDARGRLVEITLADREPGQPGGHVTYQRSTACDAIAPRISEAPVDAICITSPFGRVRHCL